MNALQLLAIAHALGLWVFHQQAQLPLWLRSATNQLPTPMLVLGTWLLVFLVLFKTIRWRQGPRTLVVLGLGLISAWAPAGWMAAQRLNHQVPLNCHRQVVSGEFRLLDRNLKANHTESWLLEARSNHPLCLLENTVLSVPVEPTNGLPQVQIGDTFKASLSLRALHAPLQLEGFDVHQYWMSQGIGGLAVLKSAPLVQQDSNGFAPLFWFLQLRDHMRRWLMWALNDHEQLPLIMAMVIGDQGLIDPESRALYANTGIAHLVAISGLHITLFAMLAAQCIAWLWRRSPKLCRWISAPSAGGVGGLLCALAYALVAGWGPPAQRTVFMLAAMQIGQWRSTNQSPWDTWCLALLLTLAFNPWGILDYGFLLSFGAVAVLIFSFHGRYTFSSKVPEKLRQLWVAQWAVTVGLLVPSALMFHQQSLVSPIVNALSIPWMSFVSTPLALLGGLLHQHWALNLAAYSLDIQRLWLDYFGSFSWATWTIPTLPWWAIALAALGSLLLLLPHWLVPPWLGLSLLLFLLWPAPRPKAGEFWMSVMDVGQGTALAIQTQNHLLIYDTGPAKNALSDSGLRVVLPWLQTKGYRQVDQLWVSHSDMDHAGGAKSVLAHTQVLKFVSSMPKTHELNQLAEQQHIPTMNCHEQHAWQWDNINFEPIPIPELPDNNKANADNNRSCILRIRNTQHSVLLTGDVEAFSEALLLISQPAERLRSSVLLAPHHGSKTSSTQAFLQAVNPKTVVIQAGWNNSYGHPHPDVLARYQRAGMDILQTPQLGALEFQFSSTLPTFTWTSASMVRDRYWHLHKFSAVVR